MKKNSILLAACCCALSLAVGCAAPGAPQPPSLRLPTAVDNLSATRKGDHVVLSWSPPTETTDHQKMRWPSVTRVCRVINQFPTNICGEVVKEIKSSELATVPAGRRRIASFEDVLPPSLISAQNQATYTIEVVNQYGHSTGLSNQVRIPLVPTAPPPSDFRATLDGQGPMLQWNVPSSPAPSADVSYRLRIYRRSSKGKADFALSSEQPYRVGEGEARDNNFEWEQEYDYKIAAVTVKAIPGQAAVEVEGDDSAIRHLFVHDVFPPAIPGGLQAVFSSVGQKPFIDLTWAPNTESDLAGYIVFRRTADSNFVAVVTAPVKAPAWRDNDVQPGRKYYYTVAAVDVRGNQSAQSAPAEESVPLEVR